MKLFVCDDHDGMYLPGLSIVFAENEVQAREILDTALLEHDLAPSQQREYTFKVHEIDFAQPQALVLWNGDY